MIGNEELYLRIVARSERCVVSPDVFPQLPSIHLNNFS